jgi:alpha-1,6-mannosyltransferase
MQSLRALHYGQLTAYLGSMLALHFVVERPDIGHPVTRGFWLMALLLVLAMACYGSLVHRVTDLGAQRRLLGVGILLRVALAFSLPQLSDDFYRYVWDGRLLVAGQNPYDILPTAWMAQLSQAEISQWQDLFGHLNSQQYYSVYPPVMQAIFGFAAWMAGGDLLGTVIGIKVVIVAAEIGSIWLLGKLVARLQLPSWSVLLYALNPLVILELSGNMHTEAVMIFFLLATLWLLMRYRYWWAALPLALAIGAKLLPVLIFPFLLRRLGWKKTFGLGMATAVLFLGIFATLLDLENVPHFFQSLRLYFQYFEFNAGLYDLLRLPLGSQGYWVNRFLPWVMMGLILYSAWRDRDRGWQGLGPALMLALTLYQLHSPVVHPWYITPLVALTVLGRYRYAILWSLLLPLTYLAYFTPDAHVPGWLVVGEYALLFGWMLYEWLFVRSRLNLSEWLLARPWFRGLVMRSIPARLRIKEGRIARHLARGQHILDIGAGHGGLCKALRTAGLDVTPVDVKNLSFFPDVQPIVYDGVQLPFAEDAFDVSLLITMLHHTPDPEAVLREALRVTRKRLVVMEDIYSNQLQRQLTFFTDSLVNLEFEGHPHTNKSDAEWRALFERLGLRLTYREDFRTLIFFRQVIYVLEIGGE